MTSDRTGQFGRGPERVSEEDLRLWREVMRDVRPLPGRALPPPPLPPAPAAAPQALMLLTPAPPAPPIPPPPHRPQKLPEERHGQVAGLDRRSTQRLRRGQLAVEARLDLHGMTREAAHFALDRFLRSAQEAGLRTVLVITGKGMGDEGVLRRAVPRWLHEGGNRERVLTYAPARPQHGGGGALYVMLRRRRG